MRAAIVDLTNDQRRRQGRAPLRAHPQLAASAQAFAAYLARTDRLAHEADGRRPDQRASAHGYRWCSIAENIGYHYDSAGIGTQALARTLVDGWMRSPGHRRNLLATRTLDIGVGVARSGATGRYYAVQMFGRGGKDCAAPRR